MKAHGIHQSTSSIKNASVSSSPRTKAAVKTTPKGKKRSFEEYDEKDATGDDDEGLPKGKQAVKSKVEGDSDEIKVKHEVNGYTITEHLLKSEHPEVQSTGYDSGYGKTDGAYDGPSDRMQQYPAYKEETMFTDFLKQEVLEDQKVRTARSLSFLLSTAVLPRLRLYEQRQHLALETCAAARCATVSRVS